MSNEAIAEIDASAKDGNMAGVCEIEDLFEFMLANSRVWSRNWNNNTALAAESAGEFDLIVVVVLNMKGFNEGKIKRCLDCHEVWKLLLTKVLKVRQLAVDGGLIISKIIEP